VPKERKSVDKAEPAPAGEKLVQSAALNPSAKEFVPKMASPESYPVVPPVVCFVPAYYPPAEGTSPEQTAAKQAEGIGISSILCFRSKKGC